MNNLSEVRPLISIGMFVYNGDSSIRKAIDSILNQTFKEFELIISDNASTDKTEEICLAYAQGDNRIRYIRQEKNIGAAANCLVVLDIARGEFFTWAAHDDIKSPNFLELNFKFLANNPSYVASTSPVRFKGGVADPVKMSDQSLDQDSPSERFLSCLSTWRANGRYYSLYRRTAMLSCGSLRNQFYMGGDMVFTLEMSLTGKYKRIDDGFVELGRYGVSGSGRLYALHRHGLMSWMFPLSEFTLNVWRLASGLPALSRLLVLKKLIYINFVSFFHQFKTELRLKWSACK